ncbi:MAG: hypothetical protein HC842_09970, partial [Cytophagales bacterium]|nr:hypothetical protein [Cytophagales bacterium]
MEPSPWTNHWVTVPHRLPPLNFDLSLRYARNERSIRNLNNENRPVGPQPFPVVTLGYKRGVSGLWAADYDYRQLYLSVVHTKAKALGIGTADYRIFGGYSLDAVPYALLR